MENQNLNEEKNELSEDELEQVAGGKYYGLPDGVSKGHWHHYSCGCGNDWWTTDCGVDGTDRCDRCGKYVPHWEDKWVW